VTPIERHPSHHITTSSFFRRLNLLDIDSYYHNRLLCWAGNVVRMPMSRAPWQLLTSWVAHSRPVGCPQMTWGRTLEIALTSKGISKEFKEWVAIAKDRPKWRQQNHSKPKPPGARWLMDNLSVYGHNFFMQKGHSAQSDVY